MIRASAPGSIMITGEHAVVYGHPAIVAAIEQRISVALRPRADRRLRITSQIAAPLDIPLQDVQQTAQDQQVQGGSYRFVLAAIARHIETLSTGFELDIKSEIDPTLGLGSSAAVTVACLGAIKQLCGVGFADVHDDALAIVRAIQGRGSGADLAASFQGGMLAYRIPKTDGESAQISALPAPPALGLKYCGYKTPTGVVLHQIAERMQGNEAAFDALYLRMGQTSQATITAAQAQDWSQFFRLLTQYQHQMVELGVCDDTLRQIIENAHKDPATEAVKISGSGLGDCVLAVGHQPAGFVPAQLSDKGLIVHG